MSIDNLKEGFEVGQAPDPDVAVHPAGDQIAAVGGEGAVDDLPVVGPILHGKGRFVVAYADTQGATGGATEIIIHQVTEILLSLTTSSHLYHAKWRNISPRNAYLPLVCWLLLRK